MSQRTPPVLWQYNFSNFNERRSLARHPAVGWIREIYRRHRVSSTEISR
jgi:hypothetical protein